jgi:hypothetical protein
LGILWPSKNPWPVSINQLGIWEKALTDYCQDILMVDRLRWRG